MAAHAKLSPSGSSTWLACPGSIKMTEGLPHEPGGEAALRGVRIHWISEQLLLGEKGFKVNDEVLGDEQCQGPFKIELDMLKEAEAYRDYVVGLTVHYKDSEIIAEMKVDLTDIAPDTFGHSDAVVITTDDNGLSTLHIVDLKTGSGLVSAIGNTQLKLYAYGALLEMELLYNINEIALHIVQDNQRAGKNNSCYRLSKDALIEWIENEVKPKAKLALGDDAPCVAGEKQCQWCKAATFCKTAHDYGNKLMGDMFEDLADKYECCKCDYIGDLNSFEDTECDGDIIGICPKCKVSTIILKVEGKLPNTKKEFEQFSNSIDVESCVKFLDSMKFINQLAKSYESRIEKELLAGKEVTGYKLVLSNHNKKWLNELEAFEKLKSWCPIDEIAPRKLCTPNQAETILGNISTAKRNKFNELFKRPEGSPIMVKESDKRPAIKPIVDNFEDLTEILEDDFLS